MDTAVGDQYRPITISDSVLNEPVTINIHGVNLSGLRLRNRILLAWRLLRNRLVVTYYRIVIDQNTFLVKPDQTGINVIPHDAPKVGTDYVLVERGRVSLRVGNQYFLVCENDGELEHDEHVEFIAKMLGIAVDGIIREARS